MRIRELSEKIGLSNSDIIQKLKELGIVGKKAASGLTSEEEKKLRDYISKGNKHSEDKKPEETAKDNPKENKDNKESKENKKDGSRDNRRSRNRNRSESDVKLEGKGKTKQGAKGEGRSEARSEGKAGSNVKAEGRPQRGERRTDRGDGSQRGEKSGFLGKRDERRSDRRDGSQRGEKVGFLGKRDERRTDRGDGSQRGEKVGFLGKRDDRRSDRGDDRGAFRRDDRRTDERGLRRDDRKSDERGLRRDDRKSDERGQQKNDRRSSFGGDMRNELSEEAARKRRRKRNRKKQRFDAEEAALTEVSKAENRPETKPEAKPEPAPAEPEISVIELPASVTVGELAEKIGKKPAEIIMKLMSMGIMAGINNEIDRDVCEKICEDYDIIVEEEIERDIAEEMFDLEEDPPESLKERPPVVVVMGHVDHGKTSLLDCIRKTKVTAGEAGGITQHIGAYTVSINKKPITFLDTPGHEAFTAMRMRGAMVTDIAVLVVAADDGVMPQTIEAINHAKAAGVEIIVAINKIDKPSANPDRVKQELTEYGLVAEEWGGDTICVPVSAVTKEGIDTLLEMIILVAEMKELKANPDKPAIGNIIEARLDKGRGPVATALVKGGTLHVGDSIVVGSSYGKVRAMVDDKGRQIKNAGPSIPVEILGLNEVPHAGDTFYVAKNDKQARQVAESVIAKSRIEMLKDTQKVSLEDLFSQIQSGNMKELNIVIKADVQGSVEAVKASLEKLSNDEVRIKTIHGGVGAITESDVTLASASNAIIIGFNVRPESSAKMVAEDQNVDIRLYRVIYNAIDDIKAAMQGMLDPEYEEKILGHAEVRQIFHASGVGTIAGSYVKDGKITRNSKVRLLRDNVIVYEGEVATLRRYKDDVKEVTLNYECGILLNKFNDVKVGDIIEAFIMEEIKL